MVGLGFADQFPVTLCFLTVGETSCQCYDSVIMVAGTIWEKSLRQLFRDEHLQMRRKSHTHATTCSHSRGTKTNQALVPTATPLEPPSWSP